MPKIIAFGEVLWDMLPTGPKVGGAPCNFAFHCSQLGADVTMISAVGNDRLGRELLAYYERLGLSTEQIEVVPDLPTGTVDVEIVAGQPKYTIVENVAWDRITLDSRSLEPAARADVIYFGSLACRAETSRQSLEMLLQSAPDALKVCDINLRPPFFSQESLRPLLETANVLKLSDEELTILADMLGAPTGPTEARAEWLRKMYEYRLLVVTFGAQGALLLSPGEKSYFRTERVDVVDTVGAGDSFAAQTVVGLLAGLPLDEINRRANALAAFVCTRQGGTPRHPPSAFPPANP